MCKRNIQKNLKTISFKKLVQLFEDNLLESYLYPSPDEAYIKRISSKLDPFICNKELLITSNEDVYIKKKYGEKYRASLYRLMEAVFMKLDIHPVAYKNGKKVELVIFKAAD